MRDYKYTYSSSSSTIRYEYSLYVLQSRASRSRCSTPGISGRVDMLTSPVPAARAAVATGAWVESKHDMYLIYTWKCGSLSFIFTHPPEDEKRKKRKAYLVPGAVHASTQQIIQIRGTGVCLARKTPCEQALPHCTYVLQAEQRLPSATEEKAIRSFPMERGPIAKHHSAWNPHCTQWCTEKHHSAWNP